MTSVKPHGSLTVSTVTVRRKPAFTYRSPAQSSVALQLETSMFAFQGATASPLPPSPPTRASPTPEVPQRSRRLDTPAPLLPLYHPFGTLALSLPDLDPTVFGLPAPVAVFDDPTRRSSHRQRRPAAKVRDAEDPAPSHPPSVIAETPTPETEVRDKSSPRRRRGGGPGGKRRRKEREDGDATYPAKRPRNARSLGITSGLSGTRALSREEGSPTLSNGTSAAVEAGSEEKKPERRTTRSRGAIKRRGSSASEDTGTSGTPSMSGLNTDAPRELNGGEERGANDTMDEGTVPRIEAQKAESEDNPVPEQGEN